MRNVHQVSAARWRENERLHAEIERLQAQMTIYENVNRTDAAEIERLRVVVSCADNLRKWWLNDGHELQEPSRSRLREAVEAYDAARRALEGE